MKKEPIQYYSRSSKINWIRITETDEPPPMKVSLMNEADESLRRLKNKKGNRFGFSSKEF